ncbi:MAG: aldehyde dehydrogenase [Candidatus Thiodiazotropha sp. (ex Notomyrtea botanica)]|nr:aldehyde dehydrogenase [Candidatus Thiodiazotropha sp. (ex Notomyrtea botanica)]
MANTAFFAVLIVLILGVLYVMKSSDNPPETSYNQTPKQYIELVEQKKAARQAAEQLEKSLQESTEKADQALESINRQR